MKKKLLYALLSAVIAFGLWTYVVTTVSPEWEETFYNIPVVQDNETVLHERGLMVIQKNAPTVTLKLKGNRSELVTLNRENITVMVDLARIYGAGEQKISYDISYPGNISGNSIEILNQNPQEVSLTVTQRKTAQVPVMIDYGETAVPEGYRTDKEELELSQKVVTVTGPADVVDQITAAKIDVDLDNQTETIHKSYVFTLCDEHDQPVDSTWLKTDVSEIKLLLKIQKCITLPLNLKVVAGGGATLSNTEIIMDINTIEVAGSQQMLNALGNSLLIGELRLEDIRESGIKEFDIKLPEGIVNLTGKKKLSVEVRFSEELVTREFQITNIMPINVPAGKNVRLVTKSLDVIMRGPADQIDALYAEELYVEVDFANAAAGTASYKAVVKVDNDALDAVGAVDVASVEASVS